MGTGGVVGVVFAAHSRSCVDASVVLLAQECRIPSGLGNAGVLGLVSEREGGGWMKVPRR